MCDIIILCNSIMFNAGEIILFPRTYVGLINLEGLQQKRIREKERRDKREIIRAKYVVTYKEESKNCGDLCTRNFIHYTITCVLILSQIAEKKIAGRSSRENTRFK